MRYGGSTNPVLGGGTFGGVQPVVPLRICCMGASESAKNGIMDYTWPKRLEHLLQSGTAFKDVEVKTLAISGSSFFQANTVAVYGANTMVQECIAYRPDVMIVMLGGNDLMNAVDGRTLAQVKTDADTFFSTLKAALPGCLMIYTYEQTHDSVGFPGAVTTVKNKGIASQFMQVKTAGMAYLGGTIDGLYSSEILEDIIGNGALGTTDYQTRLSNMIALDAYIATGPSTSFNIVGVNKIILNFWKLQRLGVTLPDMAHHNVGGHQLMAAWVYKQLKANTAFAALLPRLSTQIINAWQDPDAFFTYYLTASGDGYVRAAGAGVPGLNGENVTRFWGDPGMFATEEFQYPFKTKVAFWPPNLTVQNTSEAEGWLRIMIRNGPPTQVCYFSLAGGAFISTGESTDTFGDFETTLKVGVLGIGNGTYAIRIKIGTEAYGPFNLVIGAPFTEAQYGAATNTTGFTATGANVAGARQTTLNLTGVLGGAANITMPTAANLVAAMSGAFVGQTYRLRIINSSAGAFAWTVVTNTGLTLGGTMTIAQNTWRDFNVTLTSLTAVTIQSVGTGTQS